MEIMKNSQGFGSKTKTNFLYFGHVIALIIVNSASWRSPTTLSFSLPKTFYPRDSFFEREYIFIEFIVTKIRDRPELYRQTLGFANLDKSPDGFKRKELIVAAVNDPEGCAGLVDDYSFWMHARNRNCRREQTRVLKNKIPGSKGSRAVTRNNKALAVDRVVFLDFFKKL